MSNAFWVVLVISGSAVLTLWIHRAFDPDVLLMITAWWSVGILACGMADIWSKKR